MTIMRYDKVAILPVRCDYCNRLFWLESYKTVSRLVVTENYSTTYVKCKECINREAAQCEAK
jgi:hypothetical protein